MPNQVSPAQILLEVLYQSFFELAYKKSQMNKVNTTKMVHDLAVSQRSKPNILLGFSVSAVCKRQAKEEDRLHL